MRRSNRLILLIGIFLAVVALVLIATLLSFNGRHRGITVELQDGRTVDCVESYSGVLTCDWSR